MLKTKKLVIAAASCLVLLLGGGVAWAAGVFKTGTTAATSDQPNAYGACVNVKTGYLRVLERNNLHKSQWGACKQDGSERFISFPSTDGVKLGIQPFLTGHGAPEEDKGKVGQFYLDLDSGLLYGPKTSDGWGEGNTLRGPKGEDGRDGEHGPKGDRGESVYETWLRKNDLEDSDESWQQFLDELKVDEVRGPQGPPGPQGPKGDPGTMPERLTFRAELFGSTYELACDLTQETSGDFECALAE